MEIKNFSTVNINDTVKILSTDKKNGLSEKDVNERQIKYGENKLTEKKSKSFIRLFFEQMNNPMIFVLFAAVLATIGISVYQTINAYNNGLPYGFTDVGDWTDVIIILVVIFLNSLLGAIQEKKADASLEALKKLSSPQVNVIRDGEIKRVKSSELTLGDIVLFEEGDVIGADVRIIESYNLKINESSLTGESVASEKNADLVFNDTLPIGDRVNMAYASTIVAYGRGKGVVTSIGMNTEIGKIANSINEDKEELTPLQKVLKKLSKFLGILTVCVCLAVFAVSIIWIANAGKLNDFNSWIESVLNSIALAVAAIPEGLVAVVTIVLSIGVTRMVKANTIVRKLPSVETLGSVNVVCSDKTGTLTQNKMTVINAYVNENIEKNNFLGKANDIKFLATGLALCSNATKEFGDPTEIALVDFADKLSLKKDDLERELPRTDELPFDSIRKMMSTKNGKYIFTKGAFDEIIKRTKFIDINGKIKEISSQQKNDLINVNKNYSSNGLRVLALAYSLENKINEKDLIFVGMVAMIDPPREEVNDAIIKLKSAGIRTVMITGDHIDTAFAIAKKLGITDKFENCMRGTDIDSLSFTDLRKAVETKNVFARVSPQNKVDIVKALKANGQIVAMTGDGVNDAPSLKGADIGIAMGITGTDVAKDASDMILTDDNFASIEKAVEEGRGIYANIRKTVLFLLSSNIAEVLAMFVIICVGLPSPLIAIHLLWVNLLTDSLPAIALGIDPKSNDVMNEKPRDSKENFLSKGGFNFTLIYGGLITIGVLVAFFIPAWSHGVTSLETVRSFYDNNSVFLKQAQTMAFTTLAFSEIFHMLGMSNSNRSFICVFKNKNLLMFIAFIVGILLQVIVVTVPGINSIFKTTSLNYQQWLMTIGISLLPLIAHEITVLVKFLTKRRNK